MMTAIGDESLRTNRVSGSSSRAEITYFFGIRGLSSLYILYFHLNYIVRAALPNSVHPIYSTLTDWLRVGDFRVSAFFVISGYLLTLPTLRSPQWSLSSGLRGFLSRRVERLLFPYFVALALSVLLFVAWKVVIGAKINVVGLGVGLLAHVLLVHNLFPRTAFYLNDTLWNVALEFQCYLLFAFAFLPLMRRFGPAAPLALAAIVGLVPHFCFHGFLDWTRPWFITLYAMGVYAAALGNRAYPELNALQARLPWGTIWVVATVAGIVAIVASGLDTSYGAGWLQNMILGVAISAMLVYIGTGAGGCWNPLARTVVRILDTPFLVSLGRFSYSTYLIQYPTLRLSVAVTVAAGVPFGAAAVLAFFVYAPLTFVFAYVFHIFCERPFQNRRTSPDRLARRPTPVIEKQM